MLCFRKFPVAKGTMDKKGEYQDFPSKVFCLTVPKTSVGESFTVAVISGIKKLWIRGGGIKIFHRLFLSHSAEKLRRGVLYCCNSFGYRKTLVKRGEHQGFPSKIFVSQCRKHL